MQRSRLESWRSPLLLGALGLTLALTQSGCPDGAELENPAAWAGRFGTLSGPIAGTGGTPSGPVLDFTTVACAASLDKASTPEPASADFLNVRCGTCHGKTLQIAGLDLRPDAGFAQRTRNVPATFGDILCDGSVTETCIPDTCPPSANLIDSINPAASWILLKSLGTQGVCGESMPQAKPALVGDDAACMTNIVNAVAALQ